MILEIQDMRYRYSLLFICLFVFGPINLYSESIPWVSYPSANITDYGVYHFRKSFDLDKIPEKLIIHVSADNRYNLFINGVRVCYGPAKGDLKTYKYDIVDIAGCLKKGKNVAAAVVFNGGKDRALSFISSQTAFMLRTEESVYNWLNTNRSWKVYKNPAYKVISYDEMLFKERWFYGFYACGGGDDLNGELYPWGWETLSYNDNAWENSEPLNFEGSAPWNLVPNKLPFMDNFHVAPLSIRTAVGIDIKPGKWDGKSKILIAPNTNASILIDFEVFTSGYPELTVGRGANSSIKIKYAEALYEKVNLKAHRDSVNGKKMFGVWDMFRTDGKSLRTFRPLWKRTFRYIELIILTKDEPLEIIALGSEYSAYPYPNMSSFSSNDTRLNEIFEMSLRTLRLCSGETYYDTPFYEQLNYGGDNRPITAISVYNSNDDRLLREVLRLYSQSENKETGLMKSAYPSMFDFDHGNWSLSWIQTLHDYYYIRGDSAFVSQFTGNIERILGFFERNLDMKTGLIGTVKNRNFVDWSITSGSIPRSNDKKEIKQSALLSLCFAHTLDCSVSIYRQLGLENEADHWETVSAGIKTAIKSSCWDSQKQLFRDYPDSDVYSQHTNIYAILCDVVTPDGQVRLLNRIFTYDKFDEMASSYFSFFLFKAMQKTGKEELFLKHLGFWYDFIDRGHTTCGETGFASHDRSDCHAWSAHPAYFLLNSVCGIKPADVGFNKVLIAPHPGSLTSIKATMPHPKGEIRVEFSVVDKKLYATIILPKGLSGTWRYNGNEVNLIEGTNSLECIIYDIQFLSNSLV